MNYVKNDRLHLRVSKKEKQKILEKVKELETDFSTFARSLCLNYKLKPYGKTLRERNRQLSAIGNNINQIARKVNGQDHISQQLFDEAKKAFDALMDLRSESLK